MPRRSRQVLLDVVGNSADARRAIRETRDEMRRLGREQVEARIDVNERVVLAKIDRVKQRLADLSKQDSSPKVDIKTAAAFAQLDRLNLKLDRLRLKRVSIDVDVKRGTAERTVAAIGNVERGVGRLNRIVGGVPFFIGRLLSAPTRLAETVLAGFGALIEGGSALVGFFGRLGSAVVSVFQTMNDAVRGLINGTATAGQVIGSVTAAIASSIASLPTLILAVVAFAAAIVAAGALVGGLVIGLNALLGAIIALGGALVALVASAAAAAAGLGALAVAFGAALIPVAIVGIAIFSRFQAVLKAHQAQTQAVAAATQDQKTAEDQRRVAIDASRQAHEQLTQATVDGNRAMAQSVQDLRDAELGLASSRLGVKEARLSLLEAKRALAEFRNQKGLGSGSLDSLFKRATDVTSDPAQQRAAIGDITKSAKGKADPLELQQRILAVQRAQLGIKEAINQTSHAEDTLAQATKRRADFVKRGIDAYKPYRQALDAVRRADEKVARAQDQTSAAQRKHEQALKALSPTEQGALTRVNSLVKGFTSFAKVLTDPIFRAAGAVFDSLKGHAGAFEAGLKLVAEAIADVVRAIGSFLTEPATLSAFQTLSRGAADLVRQLGARAFTSFLRIMREVATSALPAVVKAAKDVAGWLGRIADQPGKIHSRTKFLVDQFQRWARLAGSLVGLVAQIFVPAAREGGHLADSMRHVVDHWRDWIRANPEKVRQFFRDAANDTRRIVKWIGEAVVWLKDHLPSAANTAADAFRTVAKIAHEIYNWVKRYTDLMKGKIPLPGGGGFKLPISPKDVLLGPMLGPRLIKKWLFGQSGGLVPGSGSGDRVPAMLEPGEFIMRRAIVKQLSLPVLHALNGGAVPQMAPAGAGVVHHHTWNLPRPLDQTRYPDPENFMALVQQAWERRGGGLS